ncbi:hypothetical protein PQ478_08750 [Alkalihalophilus pseudofirmus]|uniref:hypothetical protein n=1 Tax=Alkalihalophilus pseudofirmus TaxID=79885 RepID=UPI00259B9C9D|nr:hypothetical protein [Alkalihalophilus pseudofirmus]WEG18558.1 hypothetical protein PQ478_08750 [Alkalihalophilus pseudofirmus]
MFTWVLWKDIKGEVHRIKFANYDLADKFYKMIKKDYLVKEISKDEYDMACGLYKLPMNKYLFLAC